MAGFSDFQAFAQYVVESQLSALASQYQESDKVQGETFKRRDLIKAEERRRQEQEGGEA
jgi:hypothetical protein